MINTFKDILENIVKATHQQHENRSERIRDLKIIMLVMKVTDQWTNCKRMSCEHSKT